MKTYTHKALEAQAIQVKSPYKEVSNFIHRSHQVKYPGGRLKHFHVVDAIGRQSAALGDWILRHSDGRVEILSDEEFSRDWS